MDVVLINHEPPVFAVQCLECGPTGPRRRVTIRATPCFSVEPSASARLALVK
jgi:hypothetical protein